MALCLLLVQAKPMGTPPQAAAAGAPPRRRRMPFAQALATVGAWEAAWTDWIGLRSAMIRRMATLLLASRLAEAVVAGGIVLGKYPAAAHRWLLLPLAVYVLGNLLLAQRYRHGLVSGWLLVGDLLLNLPGAALAVHYTGCLGSVLLAIFIIKVGGYYLIFGRRFGHVALAGSAIALAASCVGYASGVWPAAYPTLPASLSESALTLGLGALLVGCGLLTMLEISRLLEGADVREQELAAEARRVREAALFQAGFGELALGLQACDDPADVLALVCRRGRELLRADWAVVWLVEGAELVAAAADGTPALVEVGTRIPITHPDAPSAAAVRERKVVVLHGLGEPGRRQTTVVDDSGMRSALVVPLLGRGGTVGALVFAHRTEDDHFRRELRQRGEILAAHAAVALERARLAQALREEARVVRTMLAVSERLWHEGQDEDLVLGEIVALTRGVLGPDRVAVLARQGVGSPFRVTHSAGFPEHERRWLESLEVTPEGELAKGVPPRVLEAAGSERLVLAPLISQLGAELVLAVGMVESPGRFGPRQAALLAAIARYGGVVLENLRLHREERQAATLARTLLEIAREENAGLSRRELLDCLARRTAEVLGVEVVTFTLWHPREQVLRVEATYGLPEEVAEQVTELEFSSDRFFPLHEVKRVDQMAEVRRQMRVEGLGQWSQSNILSLPMRHGGRFIGVLTLTNLSSEFNLAPHQVALAQGIADQAAIALENVALVDDLREASRLKSEFVATVSHELRTPLNVIMGYTDLLIEEGFGPVAEEQRSVLQRVRQSAEELLELITTTLDLNRLEAGKSPVKVEEVEPAEVIERLRAETAPLVDHKGELEMRWELATDLPPLRTDRAKLHIILKNLVGNAIKFTERGWVAVSVDCDRARDRIRFAVEDTGIGIDRKYLPVIFDMFRQVESSSTRRHGGVGLGLYIVKRLCEQLRGDIEVTSEPGKGSRFVVHLPREVRA